MTTDIHAEVSGWVADEISKQRFGEDFAYAVTLGATVVPGPAGPQKIPTWTVLITAHNPMLGEGPLYHGPVPVGAIRPSEDDVRAEVTKGIAALRDLAATKLGKKPGKPPALLNGHR